MGNPRLSAQKLTSIVDTLHFAPSHASRLLQAVDLVVFLYRRLQTHTESDDRAQRANQKLWARVSPKISHQHTWVPLAAPAQDALVRHREAQREEREFFGIDYQDHGLVFCRPDGLPLRPDRVTVEFEAHVTACGLKVVRLHDTRHGACSLMLAGGVPIEIVQMILGHSSPEVTRRVYAHLMRSTTSEQVEKAVDLLTRHRPVRAAS